MQFPSCLQAGLRLVSRLGPKVGSHMALFCIHRVNRVNSPMTPGHDDSTKNIVLVIIIIIIINIIIIL